MKFSLLLLNVSMLSLFSTAVMGCSRVFQNKYDIMVAGRSMDWAHSFDDYLFINPRGQQMDGAAPKGNSVTWTSQYGSVVSSIIGYFEGYGLQPGEQCEDFDLELDFGSDGLNEVGLSAHLLYLGEEDGTVYANYSTTENINLSYVRWVRYVLDNFATVAEAVEGMKKINTIKGELCIAQDEAGEGLELGVHMAIEDVTGDSAVFEHVGGELQIYHSRSDALIMTNEPPFDQQKEILAKYEPWGGNITLPDNLPGSVASDDRFVRLEYYLLYTPEPTSEAEAVANVKSMISATNVPFGAPYKGGVYPTFWESFVDLTNSVYYFNWMYTPNIIWIELDKVNEIGAFDEGMPILRLKPQEVTLVADVLCNFTTGDGGKPEGCDGDDDNTSGGSSVRTTTVFESLFVVAATIICTTLF